MMMSYSPPFVPDVLVPGSPLAPDSPDSGLDIQFCMEPPLKQTSMEMVESTLSLIELENNPLIQAEPGCLNAEFASNPALVHGWGNVVYDHSSTPVVLETPVVPDRGPKMEHSLAELQQQHVNHAPMETVRQFMHSREAEAAAALLAAPQITKANATSKVSKSKQTSPASKASKPANNKANTNKANKEKRRGLEIVDPTGVLPPGHKPARGRGRQVQLKKMTQAQIEAEAEARLERNRQAARDCRHRRKVHVKELEDKVDKLEADKARADRMIADLQLRIAELEAAQHLAGQNSQRFA